MHIVDLYNDRRVLRGTVPGDSNRTITNPLGNGQKGPSVRPSTGHTTVETLSAGTEEGRGSHPKPRPQVSG